MFSRPSWIPNRSETSLRRGCSIQSSTMQISLLQMILITLLATVDVAYSQTTSIPTEHRVIIAGETMGTTYLVRCFQSPEDLFGDRLAEKIENRLAEINRQMSTYLPESEISRLNQMPASQSMEISKEFAAVIEESLRIHQLTGGRFDITVGPLVKFWGFGGGEPRDELPADGELDAVKKKVGADQLVVGGASGRILKKLRSDLEIDLSAIAKGFAVDDISALVQDLSSNYMVEIGGEIRAGGLNLVTGKPWAIGIEDPGAALVFDRTDPVLLARVELENRSLATSGDYRNVMLINGKTYQHTIDPVSGYPVDHGVKSVSVIAETCMMADALATGLMVFRPAELKRFVEENNLAVLAVFQEGDSFQTWQSKPFKGQLLEPIVKKTTYPERSSDGLIVVLVTFVVFGLAIAGMAIGVIVSNRQLKGSCGGLSAMAGKETSSPCSLCSKPATACPKKQEMESESGSKS